MVGSIGQTNGFEYDRLLIDLLNNYHGDVYKLVDPIKVQRLPMKRDSVSLLFCLKRDVFRDLGE